MTSSSTLNKDKGSNRDLEHICHAVWDSTHASRLFLIEISVCLGYSQLHKGKNEGNLGCRVLAMTVDFVFLLNLLISCILVDLFISQKWLIFVCLNLCKEI